MSPGAEPIYNENSRNVPGLEARREPRLNYRALRDRKETGAIVVTITAYGAVRERVAEVFAKRIEATVPAFQWRQLCCHRRQLPDRMDWHHC